jgi:hypothetical protein
MMRLLLLAAAMGLCFTAAAQQYKWVDKDGRVQYGDAPPPGVKATRLSGPPAAPAAPASPGASGKPAAKPPSASEQDAAFRQRQQAAEKEAAKAADTQRQAAEKKESCERAQEYVRTLESGIRISRTDASGERAYLDDDQRAAEMAKARTNVQQACN